MPALDSAFEKLRWANEHLQEFRDERNAFVQSGAYRTNTEFDSEEREWAEMSVEGFRALSDGIESQYVRRIDDSRVSVSILTGEIVRLSLNIMREAPQLRWAVMVGNVVHNLRSALDILVWELSLRHQATLANGLPPPVEPIALDSPWRRTQFPIVTDSSRWDQERRRYLGLIDQALVPGFLALQPWYTGKQSGRPPEGEWPAVLQELWNRDKHRGVSFIGSNAMIRDIILFNSDKNAPLNTFAIDELWTQGFGPIEHGAPLARYRLRPSVIVVGKLPVAVRANVSFDIAFGKGSPAEGKPVLSLLERMSESIAAILLQFRPMLV